MLSAGRDGGLDCSSGASSRAYCVSDCQSMIRTCASAVVRALYPSAVGWGSSGVSCA